MKVEIVPLVSANTTTYIKHTMKETSDLYNSFEPKLVTRFKVTFTEGFKIPQYVIFSCDRPKLKCFINDTFTWEDIEMKFFDPIAPSTSEEIMKYINESFKSHVIFKLELLDPCNDVIEEWHVKSKIANVDFGHLDWYQNDCVKITMNLKVIDCKLIY
jgi:hypothetical protein